MNSTLRNFKIKLKQNGYLLRRTNGSHLVFKNEAGQLISVNKDLNRMVERRLIKEFHLV